MTRKAPQKHTENSVQKKAETSAPLRNRLTPIPSSIDTIRGYPQKLIIYRTDASKYFWVRLYFNGRYHTKSTKAVSVVAAKSFAVSFYESERLEQEQAIKQKKKLKAAPKAKLPPKPTIASPQPSKAKKTSAQEIQSQKVQSKTLNSKPQTVLPPSSSVGTVGAQNAVKTRSQKRVSHDPNSVASIQRQLDPLAFDPIVKKLTS